MAGDSQVTTGVHLVAIDIAKDWNVVLIETADGLRRSFRVANRRSDHDELVRFLRGLPGHVRVALEPTGDFHRPLAFRLLSEGFEVVGVSSVAQARFREARFGTWDKNDPKDAQVLLEMLRQSFVQTYHDPLLRGSQDLQELSGTYFQISMTRTRLQHSLLLHYLPLYFPEMRRYWHSSRGEWIVRFLARFSTPASIRALSEDAFVKEAWPLVGRKVAKNAKLKEIYEVAGSSIALPVEEDSISVQCFRVQLARYLELSRLRAELEARVETHLAGQPDYEHLRSLPGIGPVLALTILAEAGDLRRFSHHRQFLKFCGLDLAKSQSGLSRGRETLSKRGNRRLRLAFWMAGLVAVRQRENSFREKYDRYVRANPEDADLKRKARTAIAAKMARVAYAIVKTGRPYRQYFEDSIPSGSIPLYRAVEASSTS